MCSRHRDYFSKLNKGEGLLQYKDLSTHSSPKGMCWITLFRHAPQCQQSKARRHVQKAQGHVHLVPADCSIAAFDYLYHLKGYIAAFSFLYTLLWGDSQPHPQSEDLFELVRTFPELCGTRACRVAEISRLTTLEEALTCPR